MHTSPRQRLRDGFASRESRGEARPRARAGAHRARAWSRVAVAAVAMVGVGAAGCSSSHLVDDEAAPMGGAQPQEITQSGSPAGQIEDLGAPVLGVVPMDDGVVAAQLDDPPRLVFGTIGRSGFEKKAEAELPAGSLPAECAGDDVLVPGSAGLRLVDEAGNVEAVGDTGPVTAAARLDDGRFLTGQDDGTIAVRGADGAEEKRLQSLASIDQIVPSGSVGLAISRADTTVATVNPDSGEIGPVLRPGKAVANATAPVDGWSAVTDTTGGALIVLNVDPLRTHQMFPVGKAPWAAAVAPGTSIVWVALSGENRIAAYDISSGHGEEVASVPSVSSPHSLAVTADGIVVVGSAAGEGLQIVPPAEQHLP